MSCDDAVLRRWEVGRCESASLHPTSRVPPALDILPPSPLRWSIGLETHGPLGTLWVGLGLCAFYIALIWLNTLLGVFLTPLFIIPGTWLLEWLQNRRRSEQKARR